MSSPPAEKKNNRLSRLLGKRDKSPASPAAQAETTQPTIPPDSAYASSETPSGLGPSTNDNSTSDIVPAEKNSDIGNIDKDRNLGVRPSTGEVLDRDTGEVVTVVTTTTTTVRHPFSYLQFGSADSCRLRLQRESPAKRMANLKSPKMFKRMCKRMCSSPRQLR